VAVSAAPRRASAEEREEHPVDAVREAARYTAVFADGRQLSGERLSAWGRREARPELDGRPLLVSETGAPLRWLRDESLPAPPVPVAFVELAGGDLVPGRVILYRHGRESSFHRLPPHLVLEPAFPLEAAAGDPPATMGIEARWLRRVVWERSGSDRYRPATLIHRDGRHLGFRSLHWAPSAVRLLREEGIEVIGFADIAELHLPATEPWAAYYEQVAVLSPEGRSRLMEIETSAGLRLTTSTERFLAASRGDENDPAEWIHLSQPAWTWEPVWLRHESVRMRRYFLPHEVPLTRIEPVRAEERHFVAKGWPWRVGRSVQGGELRSGGRDFGWGFGVHAHTELHFDLPAAARTFRARLGLDQVAGAGGCARGVVHLDGASGAPLFKGDTLTGAGRVLDTGLLEVPAGASGARRLVLVADPVVRDRPAGADPLDIRDAFDWLEPLVGLDPAALRLEALRRIHDAVPALEGWEVEGADGLAPLALENRLVGSGRRLPAHHLGLAPRLPYLHLSRRLEVEARERWLLFALARLDESPDDARLEVLIDGAVAGVFDIPPSRPGSEADPLLLPLHEHAGREVTIDAILRAGGSGGGASGAPVRWLAASAVAEPPGLLCLLEDGGALIDLLADGDGEAVLETEERYAGADCVRLLGPDRGNALVPGLEARIRSRPRLGEFRYLQFAWKQEQGERIYIELAEAGRWGPEVPGIGAAGIGPSFRYDAGTGGATRGAAHRVSGELPRDWAVVRRDLFEDFGSFTLTGLALGTSGPAPAFFDHVYLARSLEDFDRIDAVVRGEHNSKER
jgi:hypothetical protein